jgi:hypothetical protein
MPSIVRRRLGWPILFTLVAAAATSVPVFAQTENATAAAPQSDAGPSVLSRDSPWLITPIFSSNPKLGTSAGALAGYLHYFDEKSRPSVFGVQGQYSSTESIVASVFARTSFDEDHQRVIAAFAYGNIKNDYDDYLGTGVPLKNNAELKSFVGRYTYRVTGNWFVGAQGIYQNFAIAGETGFDDQILDILGVKPFKSAALGLVVQNDSRDNENMPTRGYLLNLNNLAFRESFGGDNSYDVYRAEFRYYLSHGNGNVFAVRQLNNFTSDAPAAARAAVQLRGYKVGQYNGENMSAIEGEERYRFAENWTATIFLGVACTYGGGQNCTDSQSLFPAAGGGVQYILKPREGIVLNFEYAQGKDGNRGVYLKIGYAY